MSLAPAGAAPPDDPGTIKLFEDYVRRQQFKELEPLVIDYLKANPNSWWGHYVLGYAQFGQRRIGDSIASLAKSLQLNLKNAEAHQLLGRDLMTIGRFDAAQTELEQAVKLKPQSAEIRYDLAKIHSANDNYPPAKRELEEAIRLDPSYMEAYEALGFVMEASGDDAAAVRSTRSRPRSTKRAERTSLPPTSTWRPITIAPATQDGPSNMREKALQHESEIRRRQFPVGQGARASGASGPKRRTPSIGRLRSTRALPRITMS